MKVSCKSVSRVRMKHQQVKDSYNTNQWKDLSAILPWSAHFLLAKHMQSQHSNIHYYHLKRNNLVWNRHTQTHQVDNMSQGQNFGRLTNGWSVFQNLLHQSDYFLHYILQRSWTAPDGRYGACSPRGIERIWSFWMSSIVPIVSSPSFAMARLLLTEKQ